MVIFHSYVELPEGIRSRCWESSCLPCWHTRFTTSTCYGANLFKSHRHRHQNNPTPGPRSKVLSVHQIIIWLVVLTILHLSCAQGETLSSSPIAMVFNVGHPQYHQKWLIRGNPPQLELDVVGFSTITMTLWHYDTMTSCFLVTSHV